MSKIKTYPYSKSSIIDIDYDKDSIDIEPEYQRTGDIWNKDKKQLLIDSILNNFDIPKLYFHKLKNPRKEKSGKIKKYAI